MTSNFKRAAALSVALSMTAAGGMPAAAQGWSAGTFAAPAAKTELVKMKKHRKHARKHRFHRHGNYAFYNGYRGYPYFHPGYRYYNGFWFPPAAFLAAIIGGAILFSH